jgi:hypothetical protein
MRAGVLPLHRDLFERGRRAVDRSPPRPSWLGENTPSSTTCGCLITAARNASSDTRHAESVSVGERARGVNEAVAVALALTAAMTRAVGAKRRLPQVVAQGSRR